MNLKPLGDRVIIKQDEAEEKTASGLILTSGDKEKPQRGTVLAVGEGKYADNGTLIPVPVAVGDHVIYGKYSGQVVKDGGEEYVFLRSEDIYAVITE